MNTNKKIKKQKAKEKDKKAKVLKIRESLRKNAKEKKYCDNLERKLSEKPRPYRKDPNLSFEQSQEDIKKQIEKNLEMLKTLQEQQKTEDNSRKEINEKLESEGCSTFKEKLDVMAKSVEPEGTREILNKNNDSEKE